MPAVKLNLSTYTLADTLLSQGEMGDNLPTVDFGTGRLDACERVMSCRLYRLENLNVCF